MVMADRGFGWQHDELLRFSLVPRCPFGACRQLHFNSRLSDELSRSFRSKLCPCRSFAISSTSFPWWTTTLLPLDEELYHFSINHAAFHLLFHRLPLYLSAYSFAVTSTAPFFFFAYVWLNWRFFLRLTFMHFYVTFLIFIHLHSLTFRWLGTFSNDSRISELT